MTTLHRPLKLQLFIRRRRLMTELILARGVCMPVGMSAPWKKGVSWNIACPSKFAFLTSELGLEIATRVAFGTGFLKLSTSSCQTGACSTMRTESARGVPNLARGVSTHGSQSSRPFPPPAFAFGLANLQMLILSACTSAASTYSARSFRPGESTCKSRAYLASGVGL